MRLRRGLLRMALSIAAWLLIGIVLKWLLTLAFTALFKGWGVNTTTVSRAPVWAQFLYRWHGSLITVIVSMSMIFAAKALRRHWIGIDNPSKTNRSLFAAACAAGLGAALFIAALGLCFDSLRLQWPLTQPHLRLSTLALVGVNLLSILAEETLGKRVFFDGIKRDCGLILAVAVASMFHIASGGIALKSVVCTINVLLMALLGCALYEKRGLAASVGFRWGWSAANLFLLGFGGGEHAVYRIYGVSEYNVFGGDSGLIYGLASTLAFLMAFAWLYRERVAGLTNHFLHRS